MAASSSWKETDNCFRSSKLLVEGGGYIAMELLQQEGVTKGGFKSIDDFLADGNHKRTVMKLNNKPKVISDAQYYILYPKIKGPTNLNLWDITLTTCILTNCLKLSKKLKGGIDDIRTLRNTLYGHQASMSMDETVYQKTWANISSTLRNVSKHLSTQCQMTFEEKLLSIEKETLSADKAIATWKVLHDWENRIEDKLTETDDRTKAQLDRIASISLGTYEKVDKQFQLIQQNRCVDKTELNRKIEQARCRLRSHDQLLQKFNLTHNTEMSQEITDKLIKNKVVVLTGLPGIGKTHLAFNCLKAFLDRHQKIEPLIMCVPGEIEKVLDPLSSFIIVIDDILGHFTVDVNELRHWNNYIDTLLSQIENDKLFAIVTLRRNIVTKCEQEKVSKLFKFRESIIIDLDENDVYEREKIDIFEAYAKSNNLTIGSPQVKEILELPNTGIGFPLLCTIMKYHDITRLFSYPLISLEDAIRHLRMRDVNAFVALLLTLLNGNKLNKYHMSEEENACFKVIIKHFKSTKMDKDIIFRAAHCLDKMYLNYHNEEMYFSFTHDVITESTFKAAIENIPDILIQYCPLNYLVRFITNTDSDQDKFKIFHNGLLIRFHKDIMAQTPENLEQIAGFSLWHDTDFVAIANTKLSVQQYIKADVHGKSLLCYFGRIGLMRLLKHIVPMYDNSFGKSCPFELVIHEQIQKAIIEACKSSHCECVVYLVSQSKNTAVTDKVVFAAVKGGERSILEFVMRKNCKEAIKLRDSSGRSLLLIAAKKDKVDIVKYICETWKELINIMDSNDMKATHYAAMNGNYACLIYLLNQGIDPMAKTCSGKTILHLALEGAHIMLVEYICENYPLMLKLMDNDGRSTAHSAAMSGNVECLTHLIQKGVDPLNKSNMGYTILQEALKSGHLQMSKYICETYKTLLKAQDNENIDSVHWAAYGGNLDCLKLFEDEKKIHLNDKDYKLNPLHFALLGGHIKVVKYLNSKYPYMLREVNTDLNNTAHLAVYQSSVECLQYLVDQGIDPNEKTGNGETLLHLASLGGNIKVIRNLCKNNKQMLGMTDNDSRNAAHHAANKGSVECLQYLVDQGINPNEKTGNGETLLHRASLGGNIKVIRYLCENYKQMLDMTDNDSRNAAHHAANKCSVECLQYLICQGIDPNEKTGNGETLLHRASLGGNINVIRYLCENYEQMLYITNNDSQNAAHHAAIACSVECLQHLVDQGIDPNEKTGNGETLLHMASLGGNIKVIRYLCENYKQMLDMTDKYSRNAAHHAAKQGSVECLQYLVDQGIDPNEKTGNGETLLHRASLGGNIKVIRYLCENYKQMLDITDKYSRNAAHHAAKQGSVECLQYLVDQGIDPNEKTGNGGTLLHLASLGGNIKVIRYLCENNKQMLDMTDNDSRNAAHHAAEQGSVECLQHLVDQGRDPNEKTGNGETLLHTASLGGNIKGIRYLCENYKQMLDITDKYSRNAAHHAAKQGSVECLQYLVDQGIDPNEKTGNGETLLHLASLGGNIKVIRYLCENNKQMLDITDKYSQNAAHHAAEQGSVECLQYLVDQGIDPNEKTGNGETLLHRASLGGNIKVTRYLCENNKQMLGMTDNDSQNPAHHAAEQGSVECLQHLVDQGIDPNEKTGNGETLLHLASLGGNIKVIRYLCENNKQMLGMTDNDSQNAAHHAAEQGSVECLQHLVDQGIDPNEKTGNGETLLHRASLGGNIKVIRYLCENYKQMLDMTDNDSRNAAHHAAEQGSVECLQYLICQGIDPNEKTGNGETLLHRASLGGNINVIRYLCENYEQMLYITNNDSQNPAHHAAKQGSVECLQHLVDQGIDPNEKTGNGETLLHMASLGGNIKVIRYLCENYKQMLDMTDKYSRNAAHHAAKQGSVECLQYLVDQGIDPNEKTGNGETLLHRASLGGNIKVIRYLCENNKQMLGMTDNDSRNAAHHAANKGSVECLQYLVDQGIDPNEKTGNGETLLHLASLGENINVIRYLCENYKQMLDMTDKYSRNAAHHAAKQGSVECLQYLVDQGIDPNEKTGNGETLLHRASLSGNVKVTKFLCENYKHMLHITDNNSCNAIHFAEKSGNLECLKYLKERGVNPYITTPDGESFV